MRIERVMRVTTPEEAEIEDTIFWRNCPPQERLDHCLRLIYEFTTEIEHRLERVFEVVVLP